jgi:hypothetical protein
MDGDHSYITSALVGGKGGSENANFCLFLVLKTCWRGVQKSQKYMNGPMRQVLSQKRSLTAFGGGKNYQ